MWRAGAALWFAGIVLWALITYSVLTILTVKTVKPPLAQGISGGWLLPVVAAQSVSVLGTQLAPGFDAPEKILFFSLAMWLGGGMLYIWIISIIFYRYTFFPLLPSAHSPWSAPARRRRHTAIASPKHPWPARRCTASTAR